LRGTILLPRYLYQNYQNFKSHWEELYLCCSVLIFLYQALHLYYRITATAFRYHRCPLRYRYSRGLAVSPSHSGLKRQFTWQKPSILNLNLYMFFDNDVQIYNLRNLYTEFEVPTYKLTWFTALSVRWIYGKIVVFIEIFTFFLNIFLIIIYIFF
jgi:hypothetical protein